MAILFVCLGNICRSPLAEGIFRAETQKALPGNSMRIDSAGLGRWHIGDPPDDRGIVTARHHGIDISALRCRQIWKDDFFEFDLIIAMDHANIDRLETVRPANSTAQIDLFLKLAHNRDEAIPDPYMGGMEDFETVFQMVQTASKALAAKLVTQQMTVQ